MSAADESDDEKLALPADTLAALQEFYGQRDNRQKRFEDLKARAEDDFDKRQDLSMEDFAEDWNASQFWYSDETAITLAKQLLDGATKDSAIAVVSAPSVFIQLKNLINSRVDRSNAPSIALLEFDERFSVFKEFSMYDFEHPTRLSPELKGKFDRIICDPPFLSNDCQTKAALTVRWLLRAWTEPSKDGAGLRLILCTGERMEDLALKLYGKAGVRTTTYEVKHSKGLSNEFRCYANFESDIWKWK